MRGSSLSIGVSWTSVSVRRFLSGATRTFGAVCMGVLKRSKDDQLYRLESHCITRESPTNPGQVSPMPDAENYESAKCADGGVNVQRKTIRDDSRTMQPSDIVAELDKHIVGQAEAKKAVAIALRNRIRRRFVSPDLAKEILPRNILMEGPTGVGKTEIARRVASLAGAPFVKVEATKYTEVGFHGQDVDNMIKQLAERAAMMIQQAGNRAREESQFEVEEEILDCLLGTGDIAPTQAIREQFRTLLRKGELEDTNILIKLKPRTPAISNGREIILRVDELFGTSKAVRVQDARKILSMQLEDQDNKDFNNEVIQLTEQYGIVFIDEIDKVVRSSSDASAKGDASDRGVQSDLLPILEGTQISTKYGPVRTDHILFIASGAFHKVKVSDMMSELQGRLPVRVKLHAIDEASMYKVLTEPVSSIIKQYSALLETEGITLIFTECGLRELARAAVEANTVDENIGARRLHSVVEAVLSEVSYAASKTDIGVIVSVDREYVQKRLPSLLGRSYAKYIL